MNLTTEQIFTLVMIILTSVNAIMTYFNIRHGRKKDFQDQLYNLKLEAYKDLNDSCFRATKRLDINSSPFVEIYNFKDKDEWIKYCEKNMGEHFHNGFNMQDLTYKYSLILPSKIVDKYHDFSNFCLSFVTSVHHFDVGLIIDNQGRLWNLYIDLLNEFRADLKIEIIDDGLRQRILSKV